MAYLKQGPPTSAIKYLRQSRIFVAFFFPPDEIYDATVPTSYITAPNVICVMSSV